MDAVCAPDAGCVTELVRTAAQHLAECAQIAQDDGCGIAHHDAVCRILDIARGQTLVDVLRVLADVLLKIREEGDDVVIGGLFNLVDARDIELRIRFDVLHSSGGDLAQLRHRFARGNLYVQDGLPLVLDRPEVSHLRTRIAFYHLLPPAHVHERHKTTPLS